MRNDSMNQCITVIFMDKEKIKNDTTSGRRKRVSAIILKDGKVLVLRRVKPDREYFVIPGGGVEEGESIEEALAREIKEELTLEVKKCRFLFLVENVLRPSFTTVHADSQDEYYFLVEKYTGIPEIGGPEKERMNDQNQYQIVWLGPDEIENVENIYPQAGIHRLVTFLRENK